MVKKVKRRKKRIPKSNYFKEALESLTGKKLPFRVPSYGASRMSGENQYKLQEWCVQNANPLWATGLSMIEAAELIVQSAVDNGNIEPAKRCQRFSEGGILEGGTAIRSLLNRKK